MFTKLTVANIENDLGLTIGGKILLKDILPKLKVCV